MALEEKEKELCRFLMSFQDEDGIVRCSPEFLSRELDMLDLAVEALLERLCDKGVIVYLTRTNKDTGEVLKIISLL